MGGHCPLCKSKDWLHRADFEKQWWTGWELAGKNQGPRQQTWPDWCLLQAAWPVGACWWSVLHLWEALCSQSLILGAEFSHPDIYWKSSSVSWKQSRRLLECMKDNFIIQVIDSPTRKVPLDLLLTNMEELIRCVKPGRSLGCSDHAQMEFTILTGMGQAKTRIGMMNFRADFQAFFFFFF